MNKFESSCFHPKIAAGLRQEILPFLCDFLLLGTIRFEC